MQNNENKEVSIIVLTLTIATKQRRTSSAPNPKMFFPLNDSLHLFETYCPFLPLFNPNLDFLLVVKVKKSGNHLFHD